MFIFIFGNSSSGKSKYAEEKLLSFDGRKIYIATSKIYDDEMRARIAKHRERRKNKGFITIECSENLADVELPENSCVLIESLTAWTANEMFSDSGVMKNSEYVTEKIYHEILNIKARAKHVVLVSDDIFCGCAEYGETTEQYIKTLAGLCVNLVGIVDEVTEVFAGLPLHYKIYL